MFYNQKTPLNFPIRKSQFITHSKFSSSTWESHSILIFSRLGLRRHELRHPNPFCYGRLNRLMRKNREEANFISIMVSDFSSFGGWITALFSRHHLPARSSYISLKYFMELRKKCFCVMLTFAFFKVRPKLMISMVFFIFPSTFDKEIHDE